MVKEKLWDISQLVKNYPAFTEHSIRWKLRFGQIPHVRIKRRIYFDPEEINRWVQENKIHEIGGK